MLLFRILIFAFFVAGFPLQGYANISVSYPLPDQILHEILISLSLTTVFMFHLRKRTLKYIPSIGIFLSVFWFLHVVDIFDHIKYSERCVAFENLILIVVGLLPAVYFLHEMIIQRMTGRGLEKKPVFEFSRPAVAGIILATIFLFYAAYTIESHVCKPIFKRGGNATTFMNVSHVDYYPSPGETVLRWGFEFIVFFIVISVLSAIFSGVKRLIKK